MSETLSVRALLSVCERICSAIAPLWTGILGTHLGRPVFAVAILNVSVTGADAQSYGPNVLPAGNFEDVAAKYVPWTGVDDQGNIHGLDGRQISVGDDGGIRDSKFGPSIALGDLNGDGKPDLVLADSKGFFWFFPNSGTPQKPLFTQGEIIPIWLGEDGAVGDTEGVDDVVPRIQLINSSSKNILDVVAGTYAGKLFHIPNVGSPTAPDFRPTFDRDRLLVNTRRKHVLWCNYLAPFFTSLFNANSLKAADALDLIVGDGSYSANSIYLLHNSGSNDSPSFDEDHIVKIIPGMGLEQLTPVAIDWNNDGKPDILTGDRTGHVTLFLNTSNDLNNPTFASGERISIAGVDTFGGATTVSVGDLTGNGLPNLLIGQDDGTVLYALNTGKPGAPSFTTIATPLKGVLPANCHYTKSNLWKKEGAWGAPDELLACVNPQIEPGFTFPKGETSKYALKFYVWPVTNTYFKARYYPPVEDAIRQHHIGCIQRFTLKLNTKYRIHFWLKADQSVSAFKYKLGAVSDNSVPNAFKYNVGGDIDSGSRNWTEVSTDFKVDNSEDPSITQWSYYFEFQFVGQSTFYVDDLQIQEVL